MMTVSLFFCQLVNSKQVMLKVSFWKNRIKSFVLEKSGSQEYTSMQHSKKWKIKHLRIIMIDHNNKMRYNKYKREENYDQG